MQDKITIADAPDCLNTNDKAMWVLGYEAAIEARDSCLQQIQEPEDDIWPCINIDVDESGNITNAKLYSPGLPAGNHDVYPVRVPYMDEHTEAWRACVDELETAVPGFMSLSNMNGIECAVAAIRGLSERAKHQESAAAEQAAWHAGLDEGRAQAGFTVSNAETPQAAPAATAVPDGREEFEEWATLEGYEGFERAMRGTGHYHSIQLEQLWQSWTNSRAALAATPAAMERTCGVCGADEAFTGTCGGGRVNPTALCFEGAVATAIPAAAAPVVLPEPEAVISELMGLVDEWGMESHLRGAAELDAQHSEATQEEIDCAKDRASKERAAWKAIESKLRALLAQAATAAAPSHPAEGVPAVEQGEVLVTVSGFTGSGKSAIAGEIEILCRALGLQVEWPDGDSEKNMTHADWTEALELYKPRVRIVECSVPHPFVKGQDK